MTATLVLTGVIEPVEHFTDRLMSKTEAAKAYGLGVAAFDTLVREGRGPWTLWADDVRRGAKAHKSGGPK